MLAQKWEQKKNSDNVLSKQELNERENWTPEQRLLNDFQEQLKEDKEASKRSEIANKISSGLKLTPEEEQYMASYDSQGLADYKQTQNERKAYEEKLKNCKTKDEVQKLKTTTLGNHLASLKKIINNPVISLSEKLKKAQQILGKTKNIQAAEEEFIESGKYAELPTEAKQAEERTEETKTENEIADVIVEKSANQGEEDDSDKVVEDTFADKEKTGFETEKNQGHAKPDASKEAALEIQEIYNHLKLNQQLEASIDKKVETENEKQVGKKIDFLIQAGGIMLAGTNDISKQIRYAYLISAYDRVIDVNSILSRVYKMPVIDWQIDLDTLL